MTDEEKKDKWEKSHPCNWCVFGYRSGLNGSACYESYPDSPIGDKRGPCRYYVDWLRGKP